MAAAGTEKIVRDWFEIFWNKEDRDVALKYADNNSVFNNVDANGGSIKGVSDFLAFSDQLREAFPKSSFALKRL